MRNGQKNRNGKSKATTKETARVERGSGNVFADLGLPNPDLALAKAELVQRIRQLIEEYVGLTVQDAVPLLDSCLPDGLR